MKSIYLDCFSGISGNMFLGALLAAGFPIAKLEGELQKLHLGRYELICDKVNKAGISALYFDVEQPHHHHEHRHLADIAEIINSSMLSDDVKDKALAIFTELARAEAKVHGTTVDEVHFHEVGAIDTIIDVVGVLLGLEHLGIEKVYCGRAMTGFGYVECAHGTMPVPAPATAELLQGLPQEKGRIEKELTTPTGAVLLKCLAQYSSEIPLTAEQIVYGAGKMDLAIPNVLRAYLGEERESEGELYEAATNLDDESGEIVAFVCQQLLAAGAKDVWTEPIYMKKGRPGVTLCYLCDKTLLQQLNDYVLENTKALGVRFHSVRRQVLQRKVVLQNTPFGPVHIKVGICPSGKTKSAPEYEDVQKLAREKGLSVREIYDSI
ncbi:MAG: nickel pincer cofactor biosynthesis protein LarC [Acidaminococcaceae bacterium]|nr:nickel pincer cofactor biosynthesis protein LarC [Acidaminococcaceae bacterium]